MCTTASKFPLLIRVPVSGIRAHPNDLGLTWSPLWGLYLQIKLHFGFNIWILGGCNSTSNSCKVLFFQVFISLLKSFIVLSYQIKSKFLTLVFKLSHNPDIMYRCSPITLHAPYSSTLQSNCITLGFQTSHTFLPPSLCSCDSFCLEYPLPPSQWPISDVLSSTMPS